MKMHHIDPTGFTHHHAELPCPYIGKLPTTEPHEAAPSALPWRVILALGAIAAAIAAALFIAPRAHADPNQADLARPFSQYADNFAGNWGAHKETVVINTDGTGTETADRGVLHFKLPFVQQDPHGVWGTYALGNVTDGFLERGAYVSVQLVDGGNGMQFSAGGGDQNFPFCKMVGGSAVNSYDCGA
jgi:hypothetical protein